MGKDVAEALGYSDTDQTLRRHVDDDDKLTRSFDGSGQSRSMTIINESGLYSLVRAVRPSPARRGASAPRRAVLPRTRGMQSYALPARPTPL